MSKSQPCKCHITQVCYHAQLALSLNPPLAQLLLRGMQTDLMHNYTLVVHFDFFFSLFPPPFFFFKGNGEEIALSEKT